MLAIRLAYLPCANCCAPGDPGLLLLPPAPAPSAKEEAALLAAVHAVVSPYGLRPLHTAQMHFICCICVLHTSCTTKLYIHIYAFTCISHVHTCSHTSAYTSIFYVINGMMIVHIFFKWNNNNVYRSNGADTARRCCRIGSVHATTKALRSFCSLEETQRETQRETQGETQRETQPVGGRQCPCLR